MSSKVAYNEKTGEAVVFDGSNWVPTKTAENPETGEKVAFDGSSWVSVFKPKKTKQGALAGMFDQFTQGAAMGWGDEATALESAVLGRTPEGRWFDYSKPFGQRRQEALQAERQQQAQFSEDSPILSTAANIGGAIASPVTLGLAPLAVGKTALSTGARIAGIGGVEGALTGAGESTEGNRLSGATQGGVMGAALAPVGAAAFNLGGKALGAFRNAEKRAAGALQDVITPEQAARMQRELAKMPRQAVLADVAPKDAQRAAGAALRDIGGGRMAEVLEARQKGQFSRIVPKVAEMVSPDNLSSVLENVSNQRKAAARQQYKDVYDKKIFLSEKLKSILERGKYYVAPAWEKAQVFANVSGESLPKAWDFDPDGNIKFIPGVEPDMKSLDYMKQQLDDTVNSLYRGGQGQEATVVKGLRDELKEYIDNVVPEYKDARSVYAGYSAALEAGEEGARLMQSALSPDMAATRGFLSDKDIANFGVQEREAFLSGMASVIRGRLGSKGALADITKIFDNENIKAKIKMGLGRQGAIKFIDEIKKESKMAQTYAQLQGSQTAERQAASQGLQEMTSVVANLAEAKTGSPLGVLGLADTVAQKVMPRSTDISENVASMMYSPQKYQQLETLKMLQNRSVPDRIKQNYMSKYFNAMSPSVAGAATGAYFGGQLGSDAQEPYLLNPYTGQE